MSNSSSFPSQVNFTQHKHTRINMATGYPQAVDMQYCAVNVLELDHATANFPTVFVKDGTSGQFHLTALLGIEDNENLFALNAGGRSLWNATYTPAIVRCYPFSLSQPDTSNIANTPATAKSDTTEHRMAVCLQNDPRLVSTSEGQLLFNPNGTDTLYFTNMKNLLRNMLEGQRETDFFIQELAEKNLIMRVTLMLKAQSGHSYQIQGLYTPNREAISELADTEIADLYRFGVLSKVQAMASSLAQVNRLIQLKNTRLDDKIVNVSIEHPEAAL